MGEEPLPFSELLAGYGTTTIGEGMDIESVVALLKPRGRTAPLDGPCAAAASSWPRRSC